MSEDASHYRARAAKERTLAALADKPEVAKVHNELAERYSALAKQAPPVALKIVG